MAYPYAAPPGQYPTPRRRRRWPWVLLIVVLVLVAVAVVVDRVALYFAEDKAAGALQTSQHLNTKPDVSVAGFPFLTQLASGEFDEITISAHDVSSSRAADVELSDVVVHLHHVTLSDGYSTVRASTASADGRITYAELSRLLRTPVSSDGNGRLVTRPSVTVLGHTYSGTVSAQVRASASAGISFVNPKVTAAGVSLPSEVTNALAAVFDKGIPLVGLPFDIRVDGATVGATALGVTLSGRDLVYSR